MFGNKDITLKNKRLAAESNLEEQDIEKEYEIELDYSATMTSSLKGKKIVKVVAKTEEGAIELAQDILCKNINKEDPEYTGNDELEVDTITSKIISIAPCNLIKDTKTVDMFEEKDVQKNNTP